MIPHLFDLLHEFLRSKLIENILKFNFLAQNHLVNQDTEPGVDKIIFFKYRISKQFPYEVQPFNFLLTNSRFKVEVEAFLLQLHE